MNKTTVLQAIENVAIEVDYLKNFINENCDKQLINEKLEDIKGSIEEVKNQFTDFAIAVDEAEDECEGVIKQLFDVLK